jgi:hypothetical protein
VKDSRTERKTLNSHSIFDATYNQVYIICEAQAADSFPSCGDGGIQIMKDFNHDEEKVNSLIKHQL